MTRQIDTNNKLIRLFQVYTISLSSGIPWQVVSASEQSLILFGYTQNEIFMDSQLLAETIIHPDDLCTVVSKKKNSLMADTLFCVEYRIKTKNGNIRYVRDQYTCYINEIGTWTMEGYINEVPRPGVRDRMLHQLQAYRNAVDVNMISSITDKTGKIVYANDNFCKISKYPIWELIGQNHRIINSGAHSRKFFEDLWKTISSGDLWHGEIQNRAKDGSLYWVDTVIIPIFDEAREIVNYLSMCILITDRKGIERQRQNYTDLLEKHRFNGGT